MKINFSKLNFFFLSFVGFWYVITVGACWNRRMDRSLWIHVLQHSHYKSCLPSQWGKLLKERICSQSSRYFLIGVDPLSFGSYRKANNGLQSCLLWKKYHAKKEVLPNCLSISVVLGIEDIYYVKIILN